MTEKWDRNFLELAQCVSGFSKDPSTQVGAVIVDQNNRIVSIGYNGFPKGIKDDHRLLDRETKYKMIVHGEMNAIIFAKQALDGCTLYTVPFLSCPNCAAVVIQAGIKRVVAPTCTDARWMDNIDFSKARFREAGVNITEYDDEIKLM